MWQRIALNRQIYLILTRLLFVAAMGLFVSPAVAAILGVLILLTSWTTPRDYTATGDMPDADDMNLYVRDNLTHLKERVCQVGEINLYTGVNAPEGWALVIGQTVDRAGVYADLFAWANGLGLIGGIFGSGNGTTTFTLPDMRDRFPIGAGGSYTVGDTGGSATATLVEPNLPSHTHVMPPHTHNVPTQSPLVIAGSNAVNIFDPGGGFSVTTDTGTASSESGPAGSGTPFSVLNPNLALNYIIRL